MEDIKKIVIFGTGAVAAEITSQLEDSDWGEKIGIQIKGYVTSVKNGIENWHKYNYSSPYLGHFDDYEIQDDDYFVVAIGDNPKVKREIVTQIKQKNGKFITLIHPTAIVAKTAVIGEGNILDPFTIVGPNVHLGNFNLLHKLLSVMIVMSEILIFLQLLCCVGIRMWEMIIILGSGRLRFLM